jgi:phenylpyruvate tautomerase PptA (4-oxalocrotonate tautomerase family)
MPLMYLHYPEGAFSASNLQAAVTQLSYDAQEAELIPSTPFNFSTVWVYCRPYPKQLIFHGGKNTGETFISLEINAAQGGFSNATKKQLLQKTTDTIAKFAELPDPKRVYVVLREVQEDNFGFNGVGIDLVKLRNPDESATPL